MKICRKFSLEHEISKIEIKISMGFMSISSRYVLLDEPPQHSSTLIRYTRMNAIIMSWDNVFIKTL